MGGKCGGNWVGDCGGKLWGKLWRKTVEGNCGRKLSVWGVVGGNCGGSCVGELWGNCGGETVDYRIVLKEETRLRGYSTMAESAKAFCK